MNGHERTPKPSDRAYNSWCHVGLSGNHMTMVITRPESELIQGPRNIPGRPHRVAASRRKRGIGFRAVRLGRPPAVTPVRHALALLAQPDAGVSSIARLLGACRSTIDKYIPDTTAGGRPVFQPPPTPYKPVGKGVPPPAV